MGDQTPQLSPHAEVRKIGDLTLYIAYENTWNLVQVKCPTLGMKICIKSLGNSPPIPVLGGVGLNIDRCIIRQHQKCLHKTNSLIDSDYYNHILSDTRLCVGGQENRKLCTQVCYLHEVRSSPLQPIVALKLLR